jgi:hypothetical protein
MITGIPNHRIEDVKICNILVQHPGGGTKQQAAVQLEEKEKEYPEPTMFGTTHAHGLLIRHASGIEVSDFKVVTQAGDARPCIILDDVQRADFFNVKPGQALDSPVFVLNRVQEFSVARCKPAADTHIAEAKHQEL